MECCICLSEMKENDTYELSCNHKIHLKCFMNIICNNDLNIFIKCPLCREINNNGFRKSQYNIEDISKRYRCLCKTKQGNRCKKKSMILNNGMCYVHNKESISLKNKKIMQDYIFWLMESQGAFKSKYLMIDIAKRICIDKKNIEDVMDIMHYFYYFYYSHQDEIRTTSILKEKMYNFFELEEPNENFTIMMNKTLSEKEMFI